jgi:hypothetical protein
MCPTFPLIAVLSHFHCSPLHIEGGLVARRTTDIALHSPAGVEEQHVPESHARWRGRELRGAHILGQRLEHRLCLLEESHLLLGSEPWGRPGAEEGCEEHRSGDGSDSLTVHDHAPSVGRVSNVAMATSMALIAMVLLPSLST